MTSERATSEQPVDAPSRAPWIIAILLALIAGILIGLLSGGVQVYINDESNVVQTPPVSKPE